MAIRWSGICWQPTHSLPAVDVDGRPFAEVILDIHACYHQSLKPLFKQGLIKGAAHITGGGLLENLDRVLPGMTDADIDLSLFRPQTIFDRIRQAGKVADAEMLRAFNLGVGMALVVAVQDAPQVIASLLASGEEAWQIGTIVAGSGVVKCRSSINWSC